MSLSSVTLLDGSVVRPGDMVKLMSEDMVKEILRKKHKKLDLGDYNLQYDWLEYYYYSIDWIERGPGGSIFFNITLSEMGSARVRAKYFQKASLGKATAS